VAEHYKRNSNTQCYVCAKRIYRRPCELKKSNGRAFCNKVCFGLFCRKEKPCIICKKPILAGLHKKTCSRGCSNKHRTGIQHKIGRPRDVVVSQHAIKLRVFKEKGLKCERCGYGKYEILQVHHRNRDRNDNHMQNLELICPNCHMAEHKAGQDWLKNAFSKGGIG